MYTLPPMPGRVRITEVAPRDGLQSEPGVISTTQKFRLVQLLSTTGVDEIEVSSFVSPKWVPQLGDADKVFALAASLRADLGVLPIFSALVPNEKGMRAALDANESAGIRVVDKVAVFTAASETFSLKNTNASIEESIQRFVPVVDLAQKHSIALRAYISCAVACPFDGPTDPARVAEIAVQLCRMGFTEIDLGDTIGVGTPETVGRVIGVVQAALADHSLRPLLTLHLHDTFGHAGECVVRALELGIRSFDSSVGGLGGCPYASTKERRAPGNIATESLIKTVHGAGYKTGVNTERLAEAAAFARSIVAVARRSPERDDAADGAE